LSSSEKYAKLRTKGGWAMTLKISVDDELLIEAQKISGLSTKKRHC